MRMRSPASLESQKRLPAGEDGRARYRERGPIQDQNLEDRVRIVADILREEVVRRMDRLRAGFEIADHNCVYRR